MGPNSPLPGITHPNRQVFLRWLRGTAGTQRGRLPRPKPGVAQRADASSLAAETGRDGREEGTELCTAHDEQHTKVGRGHHGANDEH